MSELLDLGEFKSPRTTNTRTAKASKALQPFDLKYRDGTFTVSSPMWAKLGLDTNAIKLMIHPVTNEAVFVSVANDEGDIAVRTTKTGLKKFKTFKSNVLEAALADNNIIAKTVHVKGATDGYSQFISMVETPTTSGATAYVLSPAGPNAEAKAAPAQEASAEGAELTPGNVPDTEELLGASQGTSNSSTIEDEQFDEKF